MDAMLVAASYQPSLLSIPPGVALAALLVVISYAAVVRGAAELRGWFLLHSVGLVPYALAMTLAPSIADPELATTWYRFGLAMVPLAASAGITFRLALIGRRWRWLRISSLLVSSALLVPCLGTSWIVDGVSRVALGIWFPRPGFLAPVWLVATLAITLSGLGPLARSVRASADSLRRRQLRRVWIASAITSSALIDVGVVYGAGWVPLGWLLLGAGSVLTMRALVLEDLLRARAIDTRAPQLVLHLAGAVLLGWAVLELLEDRMPWWVQAVALVGAYGSVRVAVAVATLIVRGARVSQGPRERLLAQLGRRCRAAETEAQLDAIAVEGASIGVGMAAALLVPSGLDWGWSRAGGDRLDDAAAPDPLLVGWMIAQAALFVDDPETRVPAELRSALAALFAAHRARLIIPLRSRDEMLGLLVVGDSGPMRSTAVLFLSRLAERLAESLAHVRIARQVGERAALAREVDLAAQMQTTYLPIRAERELGQVRVVGAWRPATQCGGDFWAVYDVGAGRALVVVGDVTGHGVASAMVTAAVRGACDVAVRMTGPALQLPVLLGCLDAAVRRVGAERLHMSCLVAVVDAEAGEITFANAGHASPYLARTTSDGERELEALVARGHPLGAGHPMPTRVARKPIRPGDLLVWYTDGITDAANRGGEAFGDRRLQRLLRGLPGDCDPDAAIGALLSAVTLHRGDTSFDDDVTLVVASVRQP